MLIISLKDIIKNNKKYFKLGLSLLVVSILTIVFYRSSDSLNILYFLENIKTTLSPFIYGIGIAYILNPSLKFIENKILIKSSYISNRKTLKRFISISSTYIILFSFLIWIISYIIPELQESIQGVSSKIKTFDFNYLENIIKESLPLNEDISSEVFNKGKSFITELITNIPEVLNKIVSSTFGIASILLNFVLGVVISIYILFDKENIAKFNKKILYAFSNENTGNNILKFFKDSNDTFEKFFVGKIIDSAIIGIIFFIGASIINPPFVLLLSIIIGLTNIIPFFGPFIGSIPVILITLIADTSHPEKALWLLIFIFALQQFDGNILGPKILGDSIGIKPLGIIFAIIVAGDIFGSAGMFFGVPIFAVIFNLFSNYISKRYNSKYKNKIE